MRQWDQSIPLSVVKQYRYNYKLSYLRNSLYDLDLSWKTKKQIDSSFEEERKNTLRVVYIVLIHFVKMINCNE